MEVPVAEAINALTVAVTDLLPPAADPSLAPDVFVNPVKTHPAGIGGYVGLSAEPLGEIHARRLKAQVVVRVKADTLSELTGVEVAAATALVGASTSVLRSQGIYRVTRDTGFSQTYTAAEDGITAPAGRDIRFDVDFEYRREPDAPAGTIDELPLDLILNLAGGDVEALFDGDFGADPLASFDVFDDTPISNGPGAWSFDGVAGQVRQTSSASGGSNAFNPSKRGTYLVLGPTVAPRPAGSWILHAEMGADSGGIGLVFDFRDVENFHFFLMSQPTPYRMLARKSAGTFAFLDEGGQDEGASYDADMHRIRLIRQGGELEVAIDGVPVLRGREETPPEPGLVGFMCRNSPSARFRSLRWLRLATNT